MRSERYLDKDGVEHERLIFDTLDAKTELQLANRLEEAEALAQARRAADVLRRLPLDALVSPDDGTIPRGGERPSSPLPVDRALKVIIGRSGKQPREVAAALGKTTNYLDAITSGGRAPRLATLVKAAEACGYRLALVPNGCDLDDGAIAIR